MVFLGTRQELIKLLQVAFAERSPTFSASACRREQEGVVFGVAQEVFGELGPCIGDGSGKADHEAEFTAHLRA